MDSGKILEHRAQGYFTQLDLGLFNHRLGLERVPFLFAKAISGKNNSPRFCRTVELPLVF